MRICPICKRTYEQQNFAFCLDDGAPLTFSDDPATVGIPGARSTDPPKTEILPPTVRAATSRTPTLRASIPSSPPVLYAPAEHSRRQSRGGKYWIVLSGILGVVVIGLVTALGYMAWRFSNKSASEPLVATSTSSANSNIAVNDGNNSQTNVGNEPESTLAGDTSAPWMDGVWEGKGYQTNTNTTWTVRLTAQNGSYDVEYPKCRGTWTLIQKDHDQARFTEHITQGLNLCANNCRVVIEKSNDSQLSCKYSYANKRAIIATAILTKVR